MDALPTGIQLKVVHANVWSSHDALWKSSRKDKAEVQTILCGRPDDCGLLKRGECSWKAGFGWQACPYGKHKKELGYTPKANAYSKWVRDQKEKYKDVPFLKDHTHVLAVVGDYIFLPYYHITIQDVVPFLAKGGFLCKENCFLHKDHFTVENVSYLIHFTPQAAMGGGITSYNKEEVPKFVKHLQEQMPEFYQKLVKYDPSIYAIAAKYSYKGRKAKLFTVNPNIGEFIDIHKGTWIWDGEYLISKNSHASFMLCDKFDEIRVKPRPEAVVEITEEGQVNDTTIFLS